MIENLTEPKNIPKIFAFLLALSYAFGVVIHNMAISSYGIYNFDLIRAKFVLVGGGFLLCLLTHVAITLSGVAFSKPQEEIRINRVVPFFGRTVLACYLVYMFVPDGSLLVTSSQDETINLLSRFGAVTILLLSTWVLGKILIGGADFWESKVLNHWTIPTLGIAVLVEVIVLMSVLGDELMISVASFSAYYFLYYYASMWACADIERGVRNPFSRDEQTRGDRLISGTFFVYFFGIYLALLFLSVYSNIYKHIGYEYGGGELQPVRLEIEGKISDFELIDESSYWISVRDSRTGAVVRYKKELLGSIQIIETAK